MTSVLGELVAAQSAAVRGEVVDAAAVRSALAGAEGQDEEHGVELGTHERLVDLTAKVDAALGRDRSPVAPRSTRTPIWSPSRST